MSGIDRELDRVLDAGAKRAVLLGEDHRGLWSALSRATGGGKRFRPGLALATYDALAGTVGTVGSAESVGPARPAGGADAAVARVGAALELLHTAFVVHDDVIDGDDVRRGSPNVSGTFAADARDHGADHPTARRFGDAAGILAGDLALVSAVRMVARCGAPDQVVDELLELLEDTVHATAAGELADVRLGLGLSGDPCTVAEAVRVAELKTAAYSFQLPLQAGAILAGGPRDVTAALEQIGRPLGIGFQLLDDLLGVFGNASRTGKSTLSDLREGKHTALVAQARGTSAWPALRPLVGNPQLGEPDAGRARDLLEGCGARAKTQDLADGYFDEALAAASREPIPAALTAVLAGLVGEIRSTAAATLIPPRSLRGGRHPHVKVPEPASCSVPGWNPVHETVASWSGAAR